MLTLCVGVCVYLTAVYKIWVKFVLSCLQIYFYPNSSLRMFVCVRALNASQFSNVKNFKGYDGQKEMSLT